MSTTDPNNCGRRRRRPRRAPAVIPAQLSLFERDPPPVPDRAPAPAPAVAAVARIALMHGCRDEEGQPRPALMIQGRRTPTVFPTIAAALAAKANLEAAHAGR